MRPDKIIATLNYRAGALRVINIDLREVFFVIPNEED
jgi:hypothetical protein